jgi:hypothetical protein
MRDIKLSSAGVLEDSLHYADEEMQSLSNMIESEYSNLLDASNDHERKLAIMKNDLASLRAIMEEKVDILINALGRNVANPYTEFQSCVRMFIFP